MVALGGGKVPHGLNPGSPTEVSDLRTEFCDFADLGREGADLGGDPPCAVEPSEKREPLRAATRGAWRHPVDRPYENWGSRLCLGHRPSLAVRSGERGNEVSPDKNEVLQDSPVVLPDSPEPGDGSNEVLADTNEVFPDSPEVSPDGPELGGRSNEVLPDTNEVLPDGPEVVPDRTTRSEALPSRGRR